MGLEQSAADVVVDEGRLVVDQVLQPLLQEVILRGIGHGLCEQPCEVLQRVLVHRVDERQVCYHEVDDAASHSHWLVLKPHLRDLCIRALALGHTF